MIKCKLSSKRGFTLTELLVSMAVMALVGIAVAVGITSAGKAYNDITASSEANILCGTLAVEIADDLRFGDTFAIDGFGNLVYNSPRFGRNSKLISTDGFITIGGAQLLSTKSYGALRAAIAANYDSKKLITATITISGDDKIYASTTLYVIPINK